MRKARIWSRTQTGCLKWAHTVKEAAQARTVLFDDADEAATKVISVGNMLDRRERAAVGQIDLESFRC